MLGKMGLLLSIELGAYMRMKEAWRKFVPEPLFLSEAPSGGVKFLGLQLGRDPDECDDISQWSSLIGRINEDYGVQHNDATDRNALIITDEQGRDLLVAIDFEYWDDTL